VAVTLVIASAVGAARAAAPADLVALRTGAHNVLLGRCVPCHRGSADGAKNKALAVFDLDRAEWSQTVSDERLPILMDRLQSTGTPAERAQVQQFIDAELAYRVIARGQSR